MLFLCLCELVNLLQEALAVVEGSQAEIVDVVAHHLGHGNHHVGRIGRAQQGAHLLLGVDLGTLVGVDVQELVAGSEGEERCGCQYDGKFGCFHDHPPL